MSDLNSGALSKVPATISASNAARDTDGTPLSSVPIIGRGAQAMRPAEAPQLVRLQCSENFSHMWGEPTQTSAGQAHIGADGVVLEPAPIASALVKVSVEDSKTKTREFVFKPASDADLQIVTEYEKTLSVNPATGEDFGQLVIIQCPTLAGEITQSPAGTKIQFDENGFATTGERIYRQMRPAFGGDGTNADQDAHPIFFHGYVQREADNSDSSVDLTVVETEESLSEPAASAPLASAPPVSGPPDSLIAERFGEILTETIGADKVKLLDDAGLTNEFLLRKALGENNFPKGFGPASVKKLEELLLTQTPSGTIAAQTPAPQTPAPQTNS